MATETCSIQVKEDCVEKLEEIEDVLGVPLFEVVGDKVKKHGDKESLKREENFKNIFIIEAKGSEIQERRGYQHRQGKCSIKLSGNSLRANSIKLCR